MNTTLKAGLWMIGAIVSFSSMAVAGREAGQSLDTFEIMLFRSLVGLIIVASVLSITGSWSQISRARLGTHVLRNIAHFTGQNLWFYALALIPLAQVFALEFTTPLWVIVLAPLVLGEALTRIKVFAAVIGFVGILVVARPSPETINLGVITAASSAIFFALTIMLTKRLTQTQGIGNILFWLTVIQLVLGLITAGYDGDIALPSSAILPWLVIIGIAGLMAHFCFTNALAIAPATVVAPFDFARLPTITVVGVLLYNEALDPWVAVGAVIICGAIYLNILSETRKNRVVAT
ncbi:MAG: DMT family transporter [Sedimentitalea sp.]